MREDKREGYLHDLRSLLAEELHEHDSVATWRVLAQAPQLWLPAPKGETEATLL